VIRVSRIASTDTSLCAPIPLALAGRPETPLEDSPIVLHAFYGIERGIHASCNAPAGENWSLFGFKPYGSENRALDRSGVPVIRILECISPRHLRALGSDVDQIDHRDANGQFEINFFPTIFTFADGPEDRLTT